MKYIKLYLLLSSWFFCSETLAQPTQEITNDQDSILFIDFIKSLENKHHYNFYFNPTEVKNLKINKNLREAPLQNLLSEVLQNTGYFYSIDRNNNVYITKDIALKTELPISLFDYYNTQQLNEENGDVSLQQFLGDKNSTELKNNAENKLWEIGIRTATITEGKANVAGHVKDNESGEPIIGAVVYIEKPWTGVATDGFGYYSLTIPKGRHELKIKSIGMKDTKRQIMLYSNGKLDIEMPKDIIPLKEVVIEAEKDVNIAGLQMGKEKMDISAMKQVPIALGETDILKVALTLPGVQSVGESSTGLNVRGGATDQNLILFNDATIFNPTHLFGFFSAFNPDLLKTVELYKSGIPAQYGSRISSVMEIIGREGNKKHFVGSGGMGLVTGRLTLEGPIIKDKASIVVGGRSTYSDWLLKKINVPSIKNSTASFHDVNSLFAYDINEKNSLYLSGYYSSDRFRLNSDTLYSYNNKATAFKWKHIYKNNLYSVLSGTYSGYNYSVSSEENPVEAYKHNYSINQTNLKMDFNYFPSSKHTVDFGVGSIYYLISPGKLQPLGEVSLKKVIDLQNEKGLESYVYAGDKFDISKQLSIYMGLRYSLYYSLGEKDILLYFNPFARTESTIIDTLNVGKNKKVAAYGGPEFRFSARYSLSQSSSFKISYNRMRQYIHMLSNTTAISPTDVWKLSDNYIKPQIGDQYAIGIYKNNRANTIETSLEGYYKSMKGFIDYVSGANLILNPHIETDIVNAVGQAYGIELMIKKMTGKLNGWASYTYSRSMVKIDSTVSEGEVNNGRFFPSNYDKPHDFTFIGNYKFSRRFSTSLNVTYSTGRPVTLPVAKFEFDGSMKLFFSQRNQYRIPDYFRIDFSMNIEGNHKVHKLNHSSWTFSIYNLLGRKNPYSVYFISENGIIKGYKLSIFGNPIPTVTYNFKF